jgi:hypothetical protein
MSFFELIWWYYCIYQYDGNVKAQNPDGTFRHSDYSTKVPDGLKQPGYTDKWKEMVVQDNGEVLEVKKKSE